ncbi:hypothetical protein CASFOL_016850 [Castilleja foliolosa]|uniref:Pectinesterase inhibitor domain-containing protein n=1 Tax=Castilleja foliolosa TaxID=1961234 RepID=A0ABD3D9X0_9LAMI
MSSSTIPILISTIFLLFLMSNIIVTSSTNPLIEKACSNPRLGSKTKSCIKTLKSQPEIVSAKNFYDLSIAIMETGISNATNTRTYIESLLEKPNASVALKDCKMSYDAVIASFKSALSEVRDDKEFDTATYDLLIGTDDFQPCLDDVAAGKIKDPTIFNGNEVAITYGFAAYQAVDDIPSMQAVSD